MSRGPGRIQQFLKSTFDAEPDRRFSTGELASKLYGPAFTMSQRQTLNRSIQAHAPALGLTSCRRGRLGGHGGGWEHLWGRKI